MEDMEDYDLGEELLDVEAEIRRFQDYTLPVLKDRQKAVCRRLGTEPAAVGLNRHPEGSGGCGHSKRTGRTCRPVFELGRRRVPTCGVCIRQIWSGGWRRVSGR
jgi:hypothetical protein